MRKLWRPGTHGALRGLGLALLLGGVLLPVVAEGADSEPPANRPDGAGRPPEAPSLRAGAGVGGLAEPAADTVPSLEELAGWVGPGGDPALAGEGILRLMEARPPEARAPWIHLLALVQRLTPEGAVLAVHGVGLADGGNGIAAADRIEGGTDALSESDRGSLLALAAILVESDDPTRAAEFRSTALASTPELPEAPELMLRQGRWLLSIDTRRDEGITMVEDMIVAWPDHPLAPEARRLLQAERMRDRGAPPLPAAGGAAGVPR